jgi:hypothetical protein
VLWAGLLGWIGWAGLSVRADLLAYEGFESYAADSRVQDGAGGWGWTTSWQAKKEALVQNLTLSYTAGELAIDGGLGALWVGDRDYNEFAARSFADQTDTFYISFLFMTPTSAALNENDLAQVWASPNSSFRGENSASALHQFTGLAGHTQFGTQINQRTDLTLGGPSTEAGTTYFLVLKVSKTDPDRPDQFSRADLFVNPTTLAEPTLASATYVSTDDYKTLNSVGLRTQDLEVGDAFFVDELRVGTSWRDAVGLEPNVVPEPSAFLLLVGGAVSLLGFRWSARRAF